MRDACWDSPCSLYYSCVMAAVESLASCGSCLPEKSTVAIIIVITPVHEKSLEEQDGDREMGGGG